MESLSFVLSLVALGLSAAALGLIFAMYSNRQD